MTMHRTGALLLLLALASPLAAATDVTVSTAASEIGDVMAFVMQ